MIISAGAALQVYVATRPVDFRKGHDGLAAMVQEMFGVDPFCGAAFVFRSKRADRLKVLVWDRAGMVLVHKRLEGSEVRLAAGAGRRDSHVAGNVRGIVRRAGLAAGSARTRAPATTGRVSAAE